MFLDTIYKNGGKYTKLTPNYKMSMKYTKCQYYISNGHRIQISTFSIPRAPKFTQIGIFGMKI
jgi:hypothetical protein